MKDTKKNLKVIPEGTDKLLSGKSLVYDILTPAVEKRKQQWIDDIDKELYTYVDNKIIELADLHNNPKFVDAVLHITSLAVKTSEKEKIEAFKNIVINIALGDNLDDSIRHIFLSIIDRFTSHHIAILKLIDNPKNWLDSRNIPIPSYYLTSSIQRLIYDAIPPLKGNAELVELIWEDLKNVGFHNSGSTQTTMSGDGVFESRTTELAKIFLEFISIDYSV